MASVWIKFQFKNMSINSTTINFDKFFFILFFFVEKTAEQISYF